MSDIKLPPLPEPIIRIGEGLSTWNKFNASQMEAYARAAVQANSVPDDFLSHKSAWRAALVIAQGFAANEDEAAYWRHEIKAFDMAHAMLAAIPKG